MSTALLRNAAERAVACFRTAIGRVADAFTPTESANGFSGCVRDPDWQDSAPAEPVDPHARLPDATARSPDRKIATVNGCGGWPPP